MQEHVGDELVGVVERILEPVECAVAHDLPSHGDGQQRRRHIDQHIDDYQVFDDRRRLEIGIHRFRGWSADKVTFFRWIIPIGF